MRQPTVAIIRNPRHCALCARPEGFHVTVTVRDTPIRLLVVPPEGNRPALIGGVGRLGVPDALSAQVIGEAFLAAAEVARELDAAGGTSGRRYTRSAVNGGWYPWE